MEDKTIEAVRHLEQVLREYRAATKILREKPPIRYSDGDSILIAFGRNVRAERQRQKMIIPQLSKRAEVAENTIQKCERGERNVTLETADKIAHGLNVSLWTLLTDELED